MRKIILTTIVMFIITYLATSFVTIEIDFTKWNQETRLTMIIINVICNYVSIVFITLNKPLK